MRIAPTMQDPFTERTTQIVQSFKYDKTPQGAKKPSGMDYIRESEQKQEVLK